MGQYWLSVDAIALVAATAKTIFELGTSSAVRAKIKEISVEFDGTNAANTPVKVELGRFSAAVTTATTGTAEKKDPADGTAASTVKHSTTTEGAGTADDVQVWRISPTSGKHVFYPLGDEITLAVSTFFRVRCTAAQAVNVTFTVVWDE